MKTYVNPAEYDQFMTRVDALLCRKYGITSDDLCDWTWYDAWESGQSAASAANDAVEYSREELSF